MNPKKQHHKNAYVYNDAYNEIHIVKLFHFLFDVEEFNNTYMTTSA